MVEKLRQIPFLEEPAFEPDSWHCFNCGCPDLTMDEIKALDRNKGEYRILRYGSIYPLKMLYVTQGDDGRVDRMRGHNGDYSVCEPCYRLQWEEMNTNPNLVCPV